ncbi:MAG: hypothetical protein NTX97_06315 [Bacteroidetes bacterium]|nr:hypothetical protein [Bacteroidota bacterium]
MKKLMLTSATILFISLSSFAQDGVKSTKNCEKKCDMKECPKDTDCKKKCEMGECTADMKCHKAEAKACVKSCKMDDAKKGNSSPSNK